MRISVKNGENIMKNEILISRMPGKATEIQKTQNLQKEQNGIAHKIIADLAKGYNEGYLDFCPECGKRENGHHEWCQWDRYWEIERLLENTGN